MQLTDPEVRLFRDGDGPACLAALRATFEADAYPKKWPSDPEAFLVPSGTERRWVAAAGDEVAGHVVFRDATGHTDTPHIAAATGLDPAGLGLIARLWVAPSWRGRGVATALLATATGEARRRGLRPFLDVLSDAAAAISLYERLGWTQVGCRPVTWAGADRTILYYLAPAS